MVRGKVKSAPSMASAETGAVCSIVLKSGTGVDAKDGAFKPIAQAPARMSAHSILESKMDKYPK
ncbi:hypothetical protein D3C75_1362840 [compost metagenome]